MEKIAALRCVECGKAFTEEQALYTCPACGTRPDGGWGILDVEYDYDRQARTFHKDHLARAEQPVAERQLGDLHGVRRGALAQVVRDYPEREALRPAEVAADAADEHLVAAPPGGLEALEGRAVAEAELGQSVVEELHVHRLRPLGRPGV